MPPGSGLEAMVPGTEAGPQYQTAKIAKMRTMIPIAHHMLAALRLARRRAVGNVYVGARQRFANLPHLGGQFSMILGGGMRQLFRSLPKFPLGVVQPDMDGCE